MVKSYQLINKQSVEKQKLVTESSIINNGRNSRTYADMVKVVPEKSTSNKKVTWKDIVMR